MMQRNIGHLRAGPYRELQNRWAGPAPPASTLCSPQQGPAGPPAAPCPDAWPPDRTSPPGHTHLELRNTTPLPPHTHQAPAAAPHSHPQATSSCVICRVTVPYLLLQHFDLGYFKVEQTAPQNSKPSKGKNNIPCTNGNKAWLSAYGQRISSSNLGKWTLQAASSLLLTQFFPEEPMGALHFYTDAAAPVPADGLR